MISELHTERIKKLQQALGKNKIEVASLCKGDRVDPAIQATQGIEEIINEALLEWMGGRAVLEEYKLLGTNQSVNSSDSA